MEAHVNILCLCVFAFASIGWTLPTTLLQDTKIAGSHLENKVKRSHGEDKLELNVETNAGLPVSFFTNPSANKRGMRTEHAEEPESAWAQERSEPKQNVPDKPYYPDENPFEDKTVREYEKGFHYGTNRAKLDEQMENAILKSEMFGEPASINQYRYFGGSDDRRRKRSNAKRSFSRFSNRYKRELELSPEEIMTLLALLEKDKHNQPYGYRTYWSKEELDDDKDLNDLDDSEEWLEGPAYSGMKNLYAPQLTRELPRYNYEDGYDQQRLYKRQWDDYEDKKRKRFMVSKRFDPTRKLRYLNGPAQGRDDLYSLSQLLGGAQRESNMPVVRRMVL